MLVSLLVGGYSPGHQQSHVISRDLDSSDRLGQRCNAVVVERVSDVKKQRWSAAIGNLSSSYQQIT